MKNHNDVKLLLLSLTILCIFYASIDQISNAQTTTIPLSTVTYSLDPSMTYTLNNKDLIKTPNSGIFLYENNTKYPFVNTEIFDSYNYNYDAIKVIDALTFDSFPTGSNIAIKNGTLIKSASDPTVYMVEDGRKRRVNNPGLFLSQGYKWERIKTVSQQTLDLHPLGLEYTVTPLTTLESGITLMQAPGSPIYSVKNNIKYPFINSEVFESYNYISANIQSVTQETLNTFPTGDNLMIRNGSLIRSTTSPDIFIIEDGRRRKIVDPGILFRSGYKWDRIKAVSQQTLDLHPLGLEYTTLPSNILESETSLIKGPGSLIYLVKNNIKYPFVNSEIFDSYNYIYANVQSVTQETLDLLATGENLPINSGTLIRSTTSPDVFIIEDGKKRKVLDPGVLFKSGYKWENVRLVSQATVDMHPNGFDFKNVNWQVNGSLITAYGKIGKLENGQLRLFPDIETFLSHYKNWDLVRPISTTLFKSIPRGADMLPLDLQPISDSQSVYLIDDDTFELATNPPYLYPYLGYIDDISNSSGFDLTDKIRLIKTSSSDIHLVRDGKKYSFNSQDVFNSYNYRNDIIEVVDQNTFDSFQTAGAMPFKGGTLVRKEFAAARYIIDKNKKRSISTPHDYVMEKKSFDNFLLTGQEAHNHSSLGSGILKRMPVVSTSSLFIIDGAKDPKRVSYEEFLRTIKPSDIFLNDEDSFSKFLLTGSLPFRDGILQRLEDTTTPPSLFLINGTTRTKVTNTFFETVIKVSKEFQRSGISDGISFDNFLSKGSMGFQGGTLRRIQEKPLFFIRGNNREKIEYTSFKDFIRYSADFINNEETFDQFLMDASLPFGEVTLRRLKDKKTKTSFPLFFIQSPSNTKTRISFDYFINYIRPRSNDLFTQYGFKPLSAIPVSDNVLNLYPEGPDYRDIRYQPDGSIVASNGKVGEMQNGKLREFSNVSTLLSYYKDCSKVRTIPEDVFKSIPKGDPMKPYNYQNNSFLNNLGGFNLRNITKENEETCVQTIRDNNRL